MNKTEQNKSRTIALLLVLFLGFFGIHNFYLGRTGIAISQLILGIIGYATVTILIGYLPLIVVAFWSIVDLILIIASPKNDNFTW